MGVSYLATKKPILNFVVDQDLLQRIDDFRFQNRFDTRAAAVKWLLDWALNVLGDSDLLRRVEDFRIQNRFDNTSEAVKWMIERALDEQTKQKNG
jgi:hypothetical protein